MRRTEGDSCWKIGAHAHGEQLNSVAAGDLSGQRKMWRRGLVQGRNAHQARNLKPIAVAAGGKKDISLLRGHTGFLALGPGIDLNEEQGTARLFGYLFGQGLGEARPIERMDGIEQGHRLSRLVRLQRTDEMQFEPRITGDQRRPFGFGLLHPVFAEHALPRGNDRLNRLGAERFRNRHQRHARWIAAGVVAGAGDLVAHGRKPNSPRHAFHFVNALQSDSNFNRGANVVFTHIHYLAEPGLGTQMADKQLSSPQTSRRNKPIFSIRARLIVVALLAIAPLMFERVHGLESARTERAELARSSVVDLARDGAEAQRAVVYSMRALLQLVAGVYPKMPSDQSDCNRMLSELTGNVPWLRGLDIAGPDGRIKCATDPRAIGLSVADRSYFQNVLHSREFVLSDYLISRVHQTPSLIATYPIVERDGSLAGAVLASINLQWIGDLAAKAAQRSGTVVALIDGGGTLVAASADQSAFIGKNFAGHALAHDMLASDEGTTTTAGFDGIRRIFAYVRVPWTRARLAVGLDETVVHSGIDREITIAYLQLAGLGTLVLLAAWFGGERLILRPIRLLARTAARFGRGDLHVRASDESWIAEFAPLAAAFDDMADKLAAREEELQIANQHLEELASLDGLSGLANRRGFDRELEREWRRASERRQPVALMMIDIDHFKLFNDRYGHVRGDACLRAVGETLSLVTLEEAVLVARYGGEEFALLLPGLDIERATALAEESRKAIEDLLIAHAEAPCGLVTISIGVESLVPQQDQSAADLVEAADRALYAAKRRGRNMVVANVPVLLSAVG
jgi:diguanylate cyclase (GGDEF)-like protein